MGDHEPKAAPAQGLVARLQRVVSLGGAAIDSETALFRLVSNALTELGLRGAIMMREGTGSTLVVREVASHPTIAYVERLSGLVARNHRVDASTVDVYRTVLATGRPVYVEDTYDVLAQLLPATARPFLGLLHQITKGTPAIYAPLVSEGRVVGIMNAAGTYLTPADLDLVGGFAAGVSIALHNVRLQRKQLEHATAQQLVNRVLRSAVRGDPIDATIEGALEDIVEVTGLFKGAAVSLLDPAGGDVRRVFERGVDARIAQCLRAGCPALRAERWRSAPGSTDLACRARENGCGSPDVIVVPVEVRERLFAVICAIPKHPADDDELALLLRPTADALGAVLVGLESEEERERAQARYIHSQRLEAVGQLAGGIAHDFNNLMAIILLTARLVRDDLAPGHPMVEDVSEIERACERGSQLTRQLLMFSRRQAMTFRPIALGDQLRSLQSMLSRVIGEDIVMSLETPAEAWFMTGDVAAIEQLVVNLAVNARDAMPEGGRLTLRVSYHPGMTPPAGVAPALVGDWICLEVNDTGVGMDETTRRRLFDPFFTTKSPDRGSGLGLSVVDGVVRAAHGWIDVESAPAKGSTFRVWFPRHEPESAAPRPSASVPTAVSVGARILVIEDEVSLGTFLERFLRRAGHEPLLVRTASEARKAADRELHRLDLVLSDVVLPDGNGLALAWEFRRQRPDLPLLLMSGYLDDKNHVAEIQARHYEYLAKPFQPDELLRRIDELLSPARRCGVDPAK